MSGRDHLLSGEWNLERAGNPGEIDCLLLDAIAAERIPGPGDQAIDDLAIEFRRHDGESSRRWREGTFVDHVVSNRLAATRRLCGAERGSARRAPLRKASASRLTERTHPRFMLPRKSA